MAALSQDDRELIARYPLDNSLHHLHKPLRDAEQSYTSTSSPHGDTTDVSEDGHRKVISRLLSALMGTEVALDLRLKASGPNAVSELAALVRRVQKDEFSYAHYRPLVRLVIQKKIRL